MLTSWLISILVARQLGPANYGIFSFVLWLTGTVSWIAGMGLIHGVTKFIAEYQNKNDTSACTPIVIYVLKIEIAVTLIATTLLLIFKTAIADYFFSPKESFFIFVAALGLLPGMVTAIFSAAIEGIQKFEYFTYANLILSPLSFAAKLLVLFTNKSITGLLVVMLVFSFINCLFYWLVLRREGFFSRQSASRLDDVIRKKIHSYNKSVLAILLCDKVVWDKSENFFLGRFCAAQEIGFYNLGYNIAQRFISILPSTLWRVMFPAMSSFSGNDDTARMKRLFFVSTRYLAFFTFPVGIAGIILSYQILHYLYGHEFVGAQRVLQIIFASSIVATLSNPASAVLYGYNKQSFIYKFGAILAVFNIIMDLIIIRQYGAIGAAICYAVTTVLASTGGLVYTCRLMKLDYPIISLCKIFLSTAIMGIVMELIIRQNGELPGFIVSIIAGLVVYMVSSLILGTFVSEDYNLIENLQGMAPKQFRRPAGAVVKVLKMFKS